MQHASQPEEGPLRRRPPAEEGGRAEREGDQERHQDVVPALDDRAGHARPHASPCTTAASTSRCSSPSRWSATSSASSPPRGRSAATRRTTARAVAADPRSVTTSTPAKRREGRTAMEAKAQARYVRVTPQKARRVVDLIRGRQAAEAVAVLEFAPQAASEPVRKVVAERDRQRPGEGRRRRPSRSTSASSSSTRRTWTRARR